MPFVRRILRSRMAECVHKGYKFHGTCRDIFRCFLSCQTLFVRIADKILALRSCGIEYRVQGRPEDVGNLMLAGLGCTTHTTSSSKRLTASHRLNTIYRKMCNLARSHLMGSSIYPAGIRMISKRTLHDIRFPILVFLAE